MPSPFSFRRLPGGGNVPSCFRSLKPIPRVPRRVGGGGEACPLPAPDFHLPRFPGPDVRVGFRLHSSGMLALREAGRHGATPRMQRLRRRNWSPFTTPGECRSAGPVASFRKVKFGLRGSRARLRSSAPSPPSEEPLVPPGAIAARGSLVVGTLVKAARVGADRSSVSSTWQPTVGEVLPRSAR